MRHDQLTVHHYTEDPDSGPDHRGEYRCLCSLPLKSRWHDVPERTDEERELVDRMLGENE
jgi:hypothetical protein